MTLDDLKKIDSRYAKNIKIFNLIDSKFLTQKLVVVRKSYYQKAYKSSKSLVSVEDYRNRRIVNRDPQISKLIEEFLSIIKTKVSKEQYKNIEDKVERINIVYDDNINGYGLSILENWTIKVKTNVDKHTLFHELLHQVTSIEEKKGAGRKIFIGLETQDIPFGALEPVRVGVALNEGLTELLVDNYFKTFHKESYAYEENICKILELILGENFLSQCYFGNDMQTLQSRCLSLLKSEDPYMFMNFVRSLDFINFNMKVDTNKYGEKIIKNKKFVLEETSKEIGIFLSRMFISSLLEDSMLLKSRGIPNDEIKRIQQEKIENFTKLMQTKHAGLSLDISGTKPTDGSITIDEVLMKEAKIQELTNKLSKQEAQYKEEISNCI